MSHSSTEIAESVALEQNLEFLLTTIQIWVHQHNPSTLPSAIQLTKDLCWQVDLARIIDLVLVEPRPNLLRNQAWLAGKVWGLLEKPLNEGYHPTGAHLQEPSEGEHTELCPIAGHGMSPSQGNLSPQWKPRHVSHSCPLMEHNFMGCGFVEHWDLLGRRDENCCWALVALVGLRG